MFYLKKKICRWETSGPDICVECSLSYRVTVTRIPTVLSDSRSLLLPNLEVLWCLLIPALGWRWVKCPVSQRPHNKTHTQMIRYNSWLSHAHVDTWHWDSTRLGMIRSSRVGMEQVSQDFMEADKKPVEWSLPCGQGTRVMRDRGNICTKWLKTMVLEDIFVGLPDTIGPQLNLNFREISNYVLA